MPIRRTETGGENLMTEDDRATGGLKDQEQSSEACVVDAKHHPAQRRRAGYDGHHHEDTNRTQEGRDNLSTPSLSNAGEQRVC